MKILAFETSCDDTSIAVFDDNTLVSMRTASQIEIHNKTWWVVPEIASREHANVIFDVLRDVLTDSEMILEDIDYIAVTTHPGLIPSLLTGITVASTISHTLKIPILPIDHIQAHIFSNFLERDESEIVFPAVCLTVSWGHNEIYYMKSIFEKEKLWQTQDDAAWEAFDKVAKMMWLWYPGWPIISRLAEDYEWESSGLFPRVFLEKSGFGFSFSWLKSAVKREIDKRWQLTGQDKIEISFEFQSAVNEVLSYKLIEAARQKNTKTIMLAGWVSANDNLNSLLARGAEKNTLSFITPKKKLYCMDNAAMIGILAYYKIKYNNFEHNIGTVRVWSW